MFSSIDADRRKKRIGEIGETLACTYLAAKGYRCVDRNVRTREGEIDVVMRHGSVLVFVEVKTRASEAFGHPEESLTYTKMRRFRHAVMQYLQSSGWQGSWRMDCVAITIDRRTRTARVRHIPAI